MSDNVVKVAAEELKKWLDVLQQLIKEKQAYDAKQAAKIDKAEMRQLQEMRHEQMMAKFDKLANNGGEVSELKKAVEEAQKEIQSLRKQLEGPDELEVDGEVNEVEQQKLVARLQCFFHTRDSLCRPEHLVAAEAQRIRHSTSDGGVIFDDEDGGLGGHDGGKCSTHRRDGTAFCKRRVKFHRDRQRLRFAGIVIASLDVHPSR